MMCAMVATPRTSGPETDPQVLGPAPDEARPAHLIVPRQPRPGNAIQRTIHRLRFSVLAWLLQPLGTLEWNDGCPILRFHETTALLSNKHLLVGSNPNVADPHAPPDSAHTHYSFFVNHPKIERR